MRLTNAEMLLIENEMKKREYVALDIVSDGCKSCDGSCDGYCYTVS